MLFKVLQVTTIFEVVDELTYFKSGIWLISYIWIAKQAHYQLALLFQAAYLEFTFA